METNQTSPAHGRSLAHASPALVRGARLRAPSRFHFRPRLPSVFLLVFAFLSFSVSPALAAPIWSLDLHHDPTNFPPGGEGLYRFDIANLGETATAGPIKLNIALPAGVTRRAVTPLQSTGSRLLWTCPGKTGASSFFCEATGSIPRHGLDRSLLIAVKIAPQAKGTPVATATVEGGGAAEVASASEPTEIDSTPAAFGFSPTSLSAVSTGADPRIPVHEAGSHPDLFTLALDLNSIAAPTGTEPLQMAPVDSLRDFAIALPPGFLGDPSAVGECSPAELLASVCPPSSQVGRVDLTTYPIQTENPYRDYTVPLYTMAHPVGALADLAFSISGNPVHIRLSLDPANGYSLLAGGANLNETAALFNLTLTLWGVPADHSHDSERCGLNSTASECPTDLPPRPFLTLPSRCGAGRRSTLQGYDSWQHSGLFGPSINFALPDPITDCDRPRFEPKLRAAPTATRADSPTGLQIDLNVPQNETPDALATPPFEAVHLALPEGVRISPSAADGLAGCSPADIGLGTDQPVTCPDASRIGEASITTPLLPRPLQGFIYLATPHDSPSASLFALYLVVADTEQRGILIKLPGHLDLDPASGQITASFESLPQLPFEALDLSFRSGSRALLLSGPACGPQRITASVSSWAQPEHPVQLADSYRVEEGPGGAPCANAANRPFAPQLSAGTLDPVAAAGTPFVFKLSRSDADQPLSQISATLPPGLSAGVAGIPACPEAAIASISTAAGSGARQLAEPSCPPVSRLGGATIAAGAGSDPLHLSGDVYLAGPYRDAPFSLLVIVPVLAGPFDFGTLTSRAAVNVDPITAQLHLSGDPLPEILAGVPIDLRSVRLDLDRPGLIHNPTDCKETSVHGVAASSLGARAAISDRFQVGSCSQLGLRPSLRLRFSGGVGRNAHPSVTLDIRPRDGDANLSAANLTLPRGIYVDPTRLPESCTHPLFTAGACPPGARLGWIEVRSPLLARPERGGLYLLEGDNRLPDLAASVSGSVDLDLHGQLTTRRGRIRASFDSLPDLPISQLRLALQGGLRGILVNSESLCRGPQLAAADLAAHNGRRLLLHPAVTATCPGHAVAKPSRGASR